MEPIFLKRNDEILYLLSGKAGNPEACSWKDFEVLDAEKAEGAGEKHLPVIKREGNRLTVQVGSVFHPMTQEHSIGWIFLETKKGGQFIKLDPTSQPIGSFILAEDDEAIAAYAYCNLHGFWKTSI